MGYTQLEPSAYAPMCYGKLGSPKNLEHLRGAFVAAARAIRENALELHGDAVVPELYCRKIPILGESTQQRKKFEATAIGTESEMRELAVTLAEERASSAKARATCARRDAPPLPEFNEELIGKRIDSCWEFVYKVRGGGEKKVNQWIAGTITGIVPALMSAAGKKTAPAFIQIECDDGDVQLLAADRPTFWHVKKPGSWRWFSGAGKAPINEGDFTDASDDESDSQSSDESGDESGNESGDESSDEMSDEPEI